MNCKNQVVKDLWSAFNGDSVELIKELPDNSIDYSIFSPPFASLYTYSAHERDMGNCQDHKTFYEHFAFLVKDLFRVMKPGRNLSFHCMELPTSKERDGVIGLTDFPGNLTRVFCEAGFVLHSKVVIWKDPVTAMQRTKALGLLHKQIKKDSCMSRQGIPDYLITMRKPGINAEPVTHTPETFPVAMWQRYASPVWVLTQSLDGETEWEKRERELFADCKPEIDMGDTIQAFREERDERHLCCLQLPVIERGVRLWSNPNDVVFTPFGGVGSELYQSVLMGRKAIGFELKTSYYEQLLKNIVKAETLIGETLLFK